jgi:hypothetical protein
MYEDINVVGTAATLTYQAGEKLSLRGDVDYRKYMPENEEHAWHKPAMHLIITGRYNIADKFILNMNIYRITKQYAKIPSFGITVNDIVYETRSINAINDFNLGIEYRYNKKLSAFVNLNNIAAYRYFRWNNYPTQRFNFLAGLTYSF